MKNTEITYNVNEAQGYVEFTTPATRGLLGSSHVYYLSLMEALRANDADKVHNIMERLDKTPKDTEGDTWNHCQVNVGTGELLLGQEGETIKSELVKYYSRVTEQNIVEGTKVFNFMVARYKYIQHLINEPKSEFRTIFPNTSKWAKDDNCHKHLNKFELDDEGNVIAYMIFNHNLEVFTDNQTSCLHGEDCSFLDITESGTKLEVGKVIGWSRSPFHIFNNRYGKIKEKRGWSEISDNAPYAKVKVFPEAIARWEANKFKRSKSKDGKAIYSSHAHAFEVLEIHNPQINLNLWN